MGTIELLQKKGSVTYSAKLKGLFILPFQGQKCNKMKKQGIPIYSGDRCTIGQNNK